MSARILIVDDSSMARNTVRSLLEWHSFQMCGEATNGKEAIERVIQLKPDIVLLDINMPVMSGTEAAVEIRRIAPQTKILFFTIHDAPELIKRLRPFCHGFVSKSEAGTQLIPTLNRLSGVDTPKIMKSSSDIPQA